jgi:homoserine acetyltransferase
MNKYEDIESKEKTALALASHLAALNYALGQLKSAKFGNGLDSEKRNND